VWSPVLYKPASIDKRPQLCTYGKELANVRLEISTQTWKKKRKKKEKEKGKEKKERGQQTNPPTPDRIYALQVPIGSPWSFSLLNTGHIYTTLP
jgi:hypothetical protein